MVHVSSPRLWKLQRCYWSAETCLRLCCCLRRRVWWLGTHADVLELIDRASDKLCVTLSYFLLTCSIWSLPNVCSRNNCLLILLHTLTHTKCFCFFGTLCCCVECFVYVCGVCVCGISVQFNQWPAQLISSTHLVLDDKRATNSCWHTQRVRVSIVHCLFCLLVAGCDVGLH